MKKIKINFDFIKIVGSVLLFILSFVFKQFSFYFLLASYILIGYEIYISAFKNMLKGEIFDENFLMILATIGAFVIGKTDEAVMVILLFEIGEYLSDLAVDRSKASITELMDLRSDIAFLEKDGTIEQKDAKDIQVGDILVIKPGEKVPLDGRVISGESFVDTMALTGESVPRKVEVGSSLLSGFINKESVLKIEVEKAFENSTASKILELIEKSGDKKTTTEKFITRFSRIYTPVVVCLAILIVLVPTLLGYPFETFLYKALVFLVISCPCALVISVPLGFFCGIGRASKEGILVKGSNELDRLSTIETVCFDKTGTITEGKFEVTEVVSYLGKSESDVLCLAAYAEYYSNHPIGKSIVARYKKEINKEQIQDFKDVGGKGILVTIHGKRYAIGKEKWMQEQNIVVEKKDSIGTSVYVVEEGKHIGTIIISDIVKKNAREAILSLKKLGISKTMVISGDNKDTVAKICEKVGIDTYAYEMLPADKVAKIEEMKGEGVLAFVGDGLNDAPVIKLADVGIAMGGIGSDATIEAADVVLMRDNLHKISEGIAISKMTKRIVKFNIWFAFITKIIVLILGVFGFTSVWGAVFADVGVTLLSIVNALRIMKKKIKI